MSKDGDLMTLTEIAQKTNVSRAILAKCAANFDLLPHHTKPGKSPARKYYNLAEVRRVLRALDTLRAKEIPLKLCKSELLRLSWYAELMRAKPS